MALNDLPLLPTRLMDSHTKPGWFYLAQEAIAQGRLLGSEEVASRVRRVLQYVPAEKLWINPDCGFAMTAR